MHGGGGGIETSVRARASARPPMQRDRGGCQRRTSDFDRASGQTASRTRDRIREACTGDRAGRRGNRAARGQIARSDWRRESRTRSRAWDRDRSGRRSLQPGESRAEPEARRDGDGDGAAAQNAARLQLRETQFVAMKAAETARFLERAHYRPDVIIMDPPRTGAYDLMEPLIRLRPSSVIYVSCDPSTLVRDLQPAIAGGYKVRRVRAFDFFPNTHHVEVVANLLLT